MMNNGRHRGQDVSVRRTDTLSDAAPMVTADDSEKLVPDRIGAALQASVERLMQLDRTIDEQCRLWAVQLHRFLSGSAAEVDAAWTVLLRAYVRVATDRPFHAMGSDDGWLERHRQRSRGRRVAEIAMVRQDLEVPYPWVGMEGYRSGSEIKRALMMKVQEWCRQEELRLGADLWGYVRDLRTGAWRAEIVASWVPVFQSYELHSVMDPVIRFIEEELHFRLLTWDSVEVAGGLPVIRRMIRAYRDRRIQRDIERWMTTQLDDDGE